MRTFILWLVIDPGDISKIILHDMIMLWKKNILNVLVKKSIIIL